MYTIMEIQQPFVMCLLHSNFYLNWFGVKVFFGIITSGRDFEDIKIMQSTFSYDKISNEREITLRPLWGKGNKRGQRCYSR